MVLNVYFLIFLIFILFKFNLFFLYIYYDYKILNGFERNFVGDFIEFGFIQEFVMFVFLFNKFYCNDVFFVRKKKVCRDINIYIK